MINDTKMGVTSVIRNTLKLTPKEVCVNTLEIGEYFEWSGTIYINVNGRYAIDRFGVPATFSDEMVRPLKVNLEYDYRLLKEDGTEMEF